MTKVEFIAYLIMNGRLCMDRQFIRDPLLLAVITTPPLGYSLYEASWEVATE